MDVYEWKRAAIEHIENGHYSGAIEEEYQVWFSGEVNGGYMFSANRCSPRFSTLTTGDELRLLISYKEYGRNMPVIVEVWKMEEPLYPFIGEEFRPKL